MKRIKIVVQYLGTNYAGWQVQPNHRTIQGEIQSAIKNGLCEDAEVFGSGRTDAGVHAFMQTAHFDTCSKIRSDKIYSVLNRFLPEDIKILSSEEVSNTFHARFDVKQKTYEYHFYSSEVTLPLFDQTHAKIPYPFDFDKVVLASKAFLGTHDFVGFSSSGSPRKDTLRTIFSISVFKNIDGTFCFSVTGNGFLYNMVRIIAGTLIEVGLGKIKPEDLPDIINSKQRNRAGKTAPARGLVLKEVVY